MLHVSFPTAGVALGEGEGLAAATRCVAASASSVVAAAIAAGIVHLFIFRRMILVPGVRPSGAER